MIKKHTKKSETSSFFYPILPVLYLDRFYLRNLYLIRKCPFPLSFPTHTEYTNLDIIPGSSKCESLEGQLTVMNEKLRSRIWEKCLKSIRKDNYYDFIIIDMDKTAGILNITSHFYHLFICNTAAVINAKRHMLSL